MPLFVTVIIAKFLRLASRVSGRGGGQALPGLVAERLDPRAVNKLAAKLPGGVVLVTGTNGKTTTTKLLTSALEADGIRLVTNRTGSNLTRGLLSSLVEDAGISCRPRAQMALFEVDEAAFPQAVSALEPKLVMVLNLFRDQLDRYGELDQLAAKLKEAIKTVPEVILNADDPLVASLGQRAEGKVAYLGVEQSPAERLRHDVAADSLYCPVCGHNLDFNRRFFGHIGHYRCPKCHYARPKPDYTADKLKLDKTDSSFSITSQKGSQELTVGMPGLYNVYNALAAYSASLQLGVPAEKAAQAIADAEAAFGRVEVVNWQGHEIYLLLIKNPTGFNQVIQTFLKGGDTSVLVAINDNLADGRDVSWLWDVAFEDITTNRPIVATGIRATDLALRLKYAESAPAVVEPEIASALKRAVAATPDGQPLYVLPTYTAMLEIRDWFSQQKAIKRYWE